MMKKRRWNRGKKGTAWLLTLLMVCSSGYFAIPSFVRAEDQTFTDDSAGITEVANAPANAENVLFADETEADGVPDQDAAGYGTENDTEDGNAADSSLEGSADGTGSTEHNGGQDTEIFTDFDNSGEEDMRADADPDSGGDEEILSDGDNWIESDYVEEFLAEPMLLAAPAAEEGSLQYKINQAEGDGEVPVIHLKKSYTENIIIPDGKNIVLDLDGQSLTGTGGGMAAVTVYGSLTITGAGSISGPSEGTLRGIVIASGAHVILESGTITGFSTDGNGGGIYCQNNGSFEMKGGSITSNRAAGYGGGIFAYDGAQIKLTGGTISENAAEYGGGVAMSIFSGEDLSWDAASLSLCQNTAVLDGGGLYLYGGAKSVKFHAGTISGNTAGRNGGGACFASAVTNFLMSGGSISGNTAKGNGGGLILGAGTELIMEGGEIKGNTAENGGGLYLASTNTAVSIFRMSGGTIGENRLESESAGTVRRGGGAYIGGYAEAAILKDALIEKNTQASHGGGLYMDVGSTAVMSGGTITGNSLKTIGDGGGAGVYAGNAFTMEGGAISDNSCESGGALDGGGVYCTKLFTMTGGRITGNMAPRYGGGLRCPGTAYLKGEAVVSGNTTFSTGGGMATSYTYVEDGVMICDNVTTGSGGGISAKMIYMSGGTIRGNQGSSGGGLKTVGGWISGGSIIANTSTANGGGVQKEYEASYDNSLLIQGKVEISQNTALRGGGIGTSGSRDDKGLRIEGGIITKNSADYGGGLCIVNNNNSIADLTGGIIYDNTAAKAQGGNDIYTVSASGSNQVKRVGLVSAGELKLEEAKIVGTAWYDERNKQRVTDSIELSEPKEQHAYTFLYNSTGVAKIGDSIFETVQAAVDALQTLENSGQTIEMLSDSRECVTIPGSVTVTLDLAGYRLRGIDGSVITVEPNANLTIADSSAEGTGRITEGKGNTIQGKDAARRYGGGLFVRGTVTLQKGRIAGNTASCGGGVYVSAGGNFVMEGGSVSDNKGEGVFINDAENTALAQLLLKDGEISGNSGSGVKQNSTAYASFSMEGGTIKENHASGVYSIGTVTVTGGTITQNDTVGNGGGMCISGAGKLTMTGGTITGNCANGGEGGGIFVSGNGATEIKKTNTSLKIYGNTCVGSAHDIYLNVNAKCSVSAAKEMESEDYNCWYDANTGTYITDAIKNQTLRAYLTASKTTDESGEEVAKIGDKSYPSIQAAINAAREDEEILLLKDTCEAAAVSKSVVINLNGYTVTTDKSYVFCINAGKALTIKNEKGDSDYNSEGDGGVLTLADGAGYGRAVTVGTRGTLVLESGTLTGFCSAGFGGAIYAGPGSKVELRGGRITGNSAVYGGGICVNGSGSQDQVLLKLTGTEISNNTADYGGGVYFKTGNVKNPAYDNGKLLLDGSTITNNTAKKDGGGIWAEGHDSLYEKSVSSLQSGSVSENSAAGNGGGIYLYYLNELEIGNVTIQKNHSGLAGGGLYGYLHQDRSSKIAMTGGSIRENVSEASGGGAYLRATEITVSGGSVEKNQVNTFYKGGGLMLVGYAVVVNEITAKGNEAYQGGGIYVTNTATAATENRKCEITGGTITGNRAYNGGGIAFDNIKNVDTCLKGGTVSGNTATLGGGIYGTTSVKFVEIDGMAIKDNEANTGGGVYLYGSYSVSQLSIKGNTLISGNKALTNRGGGVFASYSKIDISGGTITGNTAVGVGGGAAFENSSAVVSGGEVSGNTAGTYGGGVYIAVDASNYNKKRRFSMKITGGSFCNNKASNGGALYIGNYMGGKNAEAPGEYLDGVVMSGGLISGNTAAVYGGGVYIIENLASFRLKSSGKLYDNSAGLGQDVYTAYNANNRTSVIHLMKASEMFVETDKEGIGWFDENRSLVMTEAVDYEPAVRAYPLTLQYRTNDHVARIGEEYYSSVQEAVNAIENGTPENTGGEAQEIVMIKDSAENVLIPGNVTVKLNLNGHTLKGHTTAITCYGNLTVIDEKNAEKEGEAGESGAGTITGNSPTNGGGVLVCSGGYVKMESGQISGCHAGGADQNSVYYGGAGVCADYGTFELAGTASINHCSSSYGSAVYIKGGSSTFLMTGGSIKDNSALKSSGKDGGGTIYVNGGTFRMTGGVISENKTGNGGGVYHNGGKTVISGGTIERNEAVRRGGGLYVHAGKAAIENAVIRNNHVTGEASKTDVSDAAGGGIYLTNGGAVLTINEGTEITGNTAVRGGGIYQNGGQCQMRGGRMTGNKADMGGGVAQNPAISGVFQMYGGGIYGNVSGVSGSGNDIWSHYEGTGTYPGSSQTPSMTLTAASKMGSGGYNAWRDDTYRGSERIGTYIGEGEYISGAVSKSYNLQLTADLYEDIEEEEKPVTSMLVQSLAVTKVADGTGTWDNCKSSEKTAGQLLEEGTAGFTESKEVYTDAAGIEQPYITYAGTEYKAGKYEQNQAAAWKPGDDSGAANGIVRTYDTVVYELGYTYTGKADSDNGNSTEGSGNTEGGETASENGKLRVWIKAELPYSMDLIEITGSTLDYWYVNEAIADGKTVQYLQGYQDISNPDNQGGRGTVTINTRVKGMKNGEVIQPVFRAWMEGNEKNTEAPAVCNSRPVTVSAYPRYNVMVKQNSDLHYTGYFNTVTGDAASQLEIDEYKSGANNGVVYGIMLGYGITLELYNNNSETKGKGIRGIELPEGPIQFDVTMDGSLYVDNTLLMLKDQPLSWSPSVWAYKANENSEYGNSFDNTGTAFRMNWNDEDDSVMSTQYAYDGAPFNVGDNASSCYGGGAWQASCEPDGKKTTLHFTVSGYSFSTDADKSKSNMPTKTSDGVTCSAFSAEYVKPFSAGYVQVIFPVDQEKINEALEASGLQEKSRYVEVNMNCVASKYSATSMSGQSPEGTRDGIASMKSFFGEDYEQHAVGEMTYADNAIRMESGLYMLYGENGDIMYKYNFFNTAKDAELTGDGGNGSTAIGTQVYLYGRAQFHAGEINTLEEGGNHYNPDFDPQTDHAIEYNYLTALNILQKFDADAYTPVGCEAVINQRYELTSGTNLISNAFRIKTSETATSWSQSATKSYNLTILYAAKPDGSNWTKGTSLNTYGADDGGAAEMFAKKEEDLLYFRTLQDLYDYFGYDENGSPNGNCVAILYEFRNCCIRSARYVSAGCLMNVTSDFQKTGDTYCTTNDTRGWTTYRPDYKEIYTQSGTSGLGTSEKIYRGSQTDCPSEKEGVTYYQGTSPGNAPALTGQDINGTYIKTEYANGKKVSGSHSGWMSGNCLLLYTLESSISITNTDKEKDSNAPKTHYNIDNGNRTAHFSIKPSLAPSSEIKDHDLIKNGEQSTDVDIVLTLPKHLNYDKGSIEFIYAEDGYQEGELAWDVTVTKNEDGTTVLNFRTSIADIEKALPEITYSCTIGTPGAVSSEDVQSGANLTSVVTINTVYEEISRIACTAQEDKVTIVPQRSEAEYIFKTVEDTLVELGDDLVYRLNYRNDNGANPASIELCDVLPYNGDGRGTSFTGGYLVKELRLIFEAEKDLDEYKQKGKMKYSTGNTIPDSIKNRNAMLKAFGTVNGELKGLQSRDASYSITVPVNELKQSASSDKGIALYTSIPQVSAGKAVQMEIVLSPREGNSLIADSAGEGGSVSSGSEQTVQTGGSVYKNDFFYKSGSDSAAPVNSATVLITAVQRTVRGVVWMDQDQDGKYVPKSSNSSSTDEPLAGMDVYLYVNPNTDSRYEKSDDGWKWGTGENAVSLEVKNMDGVTCVPAYDILGNPVRSVTTESNGVYTFTNLAEGQYYVVVKDEADSSEGRAAYTIGTSGSQPIPFANLGVTPKRDIKKNYIQPGTITNKSKPLYDGIGTGNGTPIDESKKAAVLAEADITNAGKGIVLPPLAEMTVKNYVTTNWNCGLYYIDVSLEKQWVHTGEVEKGTAVTFTLNAEIPSGQESGGETAYPVNYKVEEYTIKKTETGLSVSDSSGHLLKDPEVTDDGDGNIFWKVTGLALQPEGAGEYGTGQKIQYSFSETAVNGTKPLKGYITTYQTSTGENSMVTYTAVNTKIRYDLAVTKISATPGDSPVPKLSNAQFTLYHDETCENAAGSFTTNTDGLVIFEDLEAGDWYFKETKAPVGYSLNKSVFKLSIAYSDEKPCIPEIKVEKLTDEKTGASLSPSVVLEESAAADEDDPITVTYGAYALSSAPDDETASYTISISVEDECVYSLPKAGGHGIWWNTFFGIALMLAALWMSEKRKENEAQ